MKVGTDGVLLGAWARVDEASRALDAGTGTGLIALMMAQRNPCLRVDAVEVEPVCAEQARENIQRSPFRVRVNVHTCAFQRYAEREPGGRTDLVVCNPPYFHRSSPASTGERTLARHNRSLPLEELFAGSASLLHRGGRLEMILPAELSAHAGEVSALHGMYLQRMTRVYPTVGSGARRVLVSYGFKKRPVAESELVIEEFGRHGYSREYVELTRDFYLKM